MPRLDINHTANLSVLYNQWKYLEDSSEHPKASLTHWRLLLVTLLQQAPEIIMLSSWLKTNSYIMLGVFGP